MKTTRLDAAACRTAERLLRHNRHELVLGDKINPHWIDGGARFWYAVDTSAGRRFVLVDPAAGTRERRSTGRWSRPPWRRPRDTTWTRRRCRSAPSN
ncbi:hypothetical protein ACFQX6_06845 [Streptosporangium lutulentum]